MRGHVNPLLTQLIEEQTGTPSGPTDPNETLHLRVSPDLKGIAIQNYSNEPDAQWFIYFPVVSANYGSDADVADWAEYVLVPKPSAPDASSAEPA